MFFMTVHVFPIGRWQRKTVWRDNSEYIEAVCRLSDQTSGVITHLDCDGSLVFAGTSRFLILWGVKDQQCIMKIHSGHLGDN